MSVGQDRRQVGQVEDLAMSYIRKPSSVVLLVISSIGSSIYHDTRHDVGPETDPLG